jgi:hypothetical protein
MVPYLFFQQEIITNLKTMEKNMTKFLSTLGLVAAVGLFAGQATYAHGNCGVTCFTEMWNNHPQVPKDKRQEAMTAFKACHKNKEHKPFECVKEALAKLGVDKAAIETAKATFETCYHVCKDLKEAGKSHLKIKEAPVDPTPVGPPPVEKAPSEKLKK